MKERSYTIRKEDRTLWKEPIANAQARVTKKPFGIFITPEDSPVDPERFRGYHAGVDFELLPGEDAHSVIVRAACDGPLRHRDWVSGYGGVVVQQCERDGGQLTVLYGHLWLDSVDASVGDTVTAGSQIGVLGEGGTRETDGERGHLHFSVHRGADTELRGYAQTREQLEGWIDPMELL